MRICDDHWALCRKAVNQRGMACLVAFDGKTGLENIDRGSRGEGRTQPFHPLMSLNCHFTTRALRFRGLALLNDDESGRPHCPLCEFEKHTPGFVAEEEIGAVTDQISAFVRAEGLLATVN